MSKILILAAGAVGYVAGTRAGREQYDKIVEQAQSVWTNPKVRKAATDAKDAAASQAPVVKDKLSDGTSTISQKFTSDDSDSTGQHEFKG